MVAGPCCALPYFRRLIITAFQYPMAPQAPNFIRIYWPCSNLIVLISLVLVPGKMEEGPGEDCFQMASKPRPERDKSMANKGQQVVYAPFGNLTWNVPYYPVQNDTRNWNKCTYIVVAR
jgi:hypothetical protein